MATITIKKTKLKQLMLVEKEYEFVPELWAIIKEYAIPKVVEPIKIGERFLYYETYTADDKLKLDHVDLCVREHDEPLSLEKQKEYSEPILKVAYFKVIQTLKMKGNKKPKSVICHMDKRDEGVFQVFPLFGIRRNVVGADVNTMYWDKPNEKHEDELLSTHPFRLTRDPELHVQYIKTKAKKLTRDMFPELNL
jgi:hypothetical protein